MDCRFFCLFAALAFATPAFAGAWLQPKGQGLIITQASYFSSANFYTSDGATQTQPRFSKLELQPYVEYGALDWLTLGGSAYLQTLSQSGVANYGVADPELFVRAPLWRDETQVLSIQPLMKFSSYFESASPPRGGSKSTDMELALLYGRNLQLIGPGDYIDLRSAYRWRDRNLGAQWRADAALGLKVMEDVDLIPALRAIYTPAIKDSTSFSNSGDVDYHLLKAEVTGIYHLDARQWLQAGIFGHVAGVQTGDGYGISLGYARRF